MPNKSSISKQSFLQGTAILTFSALMCKAIGALFKIPLTRLITVEGAGHFAVAYNIYIVLLNISSTGLPIAVSKLISQADTFHDFRKIRQIHHTSLILFMTIGLLFSSVSFLFAPRIAGWMRDPDAVYAILVLSPAVLCVCINSAFRGYFQGQQYMTPTAVSQVIEALCKLILGLIAAFAALKAGWSYPKVAGASILGVTAGCVLSSVYLFSRYRQNPLGISQEKVSPEFRKTSRQILRLAIPITLGATGFQLLNLLSSKVILGRLQDTLMLPLPEASSLLGIYTNTMTLFILPTALVQPLAVSIVPAISSALAMNDRSECRRKMESAIRLVGLIALPCGVGMMTLAGPLQGLIYGYDAATKAIAGPLLFVLGGSTVLYCIVLVTNAILQAHGKVYIAICTTVAGGIAGLSATYYLVGREDLQILGAAIGTGIYCLTAIAVNVIAMKRLPQSPAFLPQLYKTLGAAVLMSLSAKGIYLLFHNTVLAVGGAGILYGIFVCLFRVITWYDCCLFSRGEKIAKFLHIPNPDQTQ